MTCLVLSSSRHDDAAPAEIARGERPRLDTLEIARALGADVAYPAADLPAWRSKTERLLASDIAQANAAWRSRGNYGSWLSLSEKVGLPLALRGRSGLPHVMVAHNLDTGRKRGLHALTHVLERFDTIACLSRAQETFLRERVKLPAERIQFVWDNVDDQFFHPMASAGDGDYILAVGRENRDYATLINAARRTSLPTVIVAGSLWSSRSLTLGPGHLPSNVTVRAEFVPYAELRTLYAGARFVVVPLHASGYAAGVNGVLEAMAMGRASIVSQSPGLAEYLADGVTNIVVPPGDVQAMADALTDLWNSAWERAAMGDAARRKVSKNMGLDAYVQSMTSIVRKATGGT